MKIKKIKDNLLHIHNLQKALGYSIFFKAIESETKHTILEEIPKGKVLVIAPHPDDEIFGCGGTIKIHSSQGDKAKIVYLTGKNTNREKEARKGAEILGVTDLEFLNLVDGSIASSEVIVNQITKLINNFQPNIIYAPSFLDPNNDHFECANILNNVLKKMPFSGKIFLYEVWSPIYANRLIVIDKSFQSKIEAMNEHKSQLIDRHYVEAMTGLAQYRAGMFNAGSYSEAFFVTNRELYLKLFKLVSFK